MSALISCSGLLTLMSFFSELPAFVQKALPPPLVANVFISGNRKIPTDKVLEYIRTKPGRRVSQEQMQTDVQRLADSRLFKRISAVRGETIANGRVNVTFEVVEHPNIVREVIFCNARQLSIDELVEITRVQPGMPLDAWANRRACYDIQDCLRRKGYYFANVCLEEGDNESDERVVFNIMEGPRVCVRQVRFFKRGRLALAAELPKKIDTRKGVLFNPASIDDDVISLEQYYRSQGYLDVQAAREVDFSADFAHVDVTFHVGEGRRYRVAEWSLEGRLDKKTRVRMERLIELKKGDFCIEESIRADVGRLADWGGRRGKRLEVRELIESIPEQPGMVRVHFEVEDAPVHRVGEVIIVGNSVTKDEVVRKQVKLFPGQILDYTQIRASEKNLRDLGIFNVDPAAGISPTVTVLDSPGEFQDILVKVEETRTGSLTISLGIGAEGLPIFGIVLEERNLDLRRWPTCWADIRDGRAFRGAGQKLRVELYRFPFVLP